jgi:phage-related protein
MQPRPTPYASHAGAGNQRTRRIAAALRIVASLYKERCLCEAKSSTKRSLRKSPCFPPTCRLDFFGSPNALPRSGLESLSGPHVKHLEGKLWELRLTGRDGARGLHVTAIGRRVVVVRAFVKKTPKMPRAEIELALKRAKEVT